MFSFGIVMWELLTGEEPYADLHYGAIIGNPKAESNTIESGYISFWLLSCGFFQTYFRWDCEQHFAASSSRIL